MLLALALACADPAAGPPAADRATDPACAHDTGAVPSDTPAVAASPAAAPAALDTAVPASTGAGLVLYAVRHAERDSEGDDPGLTEEGLARADALAALLADVPLDAVYASDARRTQETVAPAAAAHGLPVLVHPDPDEDFAAQLLVVHGGDTLLHAGHTDTLPALFIGLGLTDAPSVSGYGQLWIVRVGADGCATVEMGHYGE